MSKSLPKKLSVEHAHILSVTGKMLHGELIEDRIVLTVRKMSPFLFSNLTERA